MLTRWTLVVCIGLTPAAAQTSRPAPRDEVLPRLVEQVENGSVADCVHALETLAELGRDAAATVPALLKTARDLGPAKGVHGGDPAPGESLGGLDADGRGAVEAHLAHTLGRIGPKAIKPLVADLLGTDPHGRAFAIRALGAMGSQGTAAVAPLCHVLRNAERGERVRIMVTLGYIGDGAHAAVADLAAELSNPDPELRMTAAQALWGIGVPAVAVLARHSLAGEAPARRAATWALARLPNAPGVATVLLRLLDDADDDVRAKAVRGLANALPLSAPAMARLRVLATSDTSYDVRLGAEVTLALAARAVPEPVAGPGR